MGGSDANAHPTTESGEGPKASPSAPCEWTGTVTGHTLHGEFVYLEGVSEEGECHRHLVTADSAAKWPIGAKMVIRIYPPYDGPPLATTPPTIDAYTIYIDADHDPAL